jgi:hypothetical protein
LPIGTVKRQGFFVTGFGRGYTIGYMMPRFSPFLRTGKWL